MILFDTHIPLVQFRGSISHWLNPRLAHRLRCGKRFTAYCRISRVEDREAINVCHFPNRDRIDEIEYAMCGIVKRRPRCQARTVWIT